MNAEVLAVHRSSTHAFSKYAEDSITLLEGVGVEGDAHAGTTVKHRSRVRRDPTAPNLRQVHLLQSELFDTLLEEGHAVFPGDLGENLTTRGVDLLALPTGTRLRLGAQAEVEITGLRNPCSQIDKFQPGLTAKVLDRDVNGALVRRAGVMAVVRRGGAVRAGDPVVVKLPQPPHHALEPV
jgi:MOSC domain-containing protein YiiM